MGPSFPLEDPRTPSVLRAAYHHLREESCPNPRYHTRLVIPRGWEPERFDVVAPSRRQAQTCLSIWRSNTEPRAVIRVESLLIDREVSPAAWLFECLRASGQQIVHSRCSPSPGGDRMDALVRGPGELGEDTISRWVVLKDSAPEGRGSLFVLSAHSRADAYEDVALDLMWAVRGFAIANPSQWPYAERLRSYMAGVPGDFVFLYPHSWELTETHDTSSLEGLRIAEIQNSFEDAPLGKVTFMCSGSVDRPAQLFEPYVSALRSHGFTPSLGELRPIPEFGGLSRCWHASGTARMRAAASQPSQAPFELRIAIGTRERAWFGFGMWGVSRQTLPALGDTNHRALDIMLQTLRTETPRR